MAKNAASTLVRRVQQVGSPRAHRMLCAALNVKLPLVGKAKRKQKQKWVGAAARLFKVPPARTSPC